MPELLRGFDRNREYAMSSDDAKQLSAIVLMPPDYRRELLQKYADRHGQEAALDLFSAFIGLSNSVVHNTRKFIELYLICEAKHDPITAEKINLPTVSGALNGVLIAIKPTKAMCHGCAFRLGTAANQSPITSSDAGWVLEPGNPPFRCHENLDARGEPTKTCRGYVKALRAAIAETTHA